MTKKILIVGPSWVGDMVMAQTLFKLLKNQKEIILDVLAPAWSFPILSRMNEVNEAIEMPFAHGELNLKGRYQLGKVLRRKDYDQAIVLPNSFKSALIPFFAKIKKRTGWKRELRQVLLNDARHLNKNKFPLLIEQYMALGLGKQERLPQEYPRPQLAVDFAGQERVLKKFRPIWRGRPIVALCAGAEFGPAKRWPAEYYAEVANKMLQKGWDVWLFGSQKDKSVTTIIMTLTNHQCEEIAGRTMLTETIDLLSLVNGVITNDSGLMHVAAALNKPLIAIYGSTSPSFTPPLSRDAKIMQIDLSCRPCFERDCPLKHERCLRDLKPELVLAEVNQWSH